MQNAARYWWVLVLRGFIAMVFGFLALAWPGLTLEVLVLWFGIYVFVDGVFGLVSAFRAASHHERWWLLLLEGLLGVFVGVYAFMAPQATALILTVFIGAWAMVSGIFEMGAAFTAPWSPVGKWTLGLAGFFSLLVGALIFWNPLGGAISLVILIGAYATAFGILLLILGFKLKSGKVPEALA